MRCIRPARKIQLNRANQFSVTVGNNKKPVSAMDGLDGFSPLLTRFTVSQRRQKSNGSTAIHRIGQ